MSKDKYVKHFTCWNQLLVLMFGQLSNRESLRDVIPYEPGSFYIFDRGYYNYQGTEYYHQGSSWYYYDADVDDWFKASDVDEITSDNADDYRIFNHSGKDFESTSWYDAGSNSDDYDWDDDDNWGGSSSDWDSGSTDWDSDW